MEFHLLLYPPKSQKYPILLPFSLYIQKVGTIFLYKSSVKLLLNGLSLQNRFL